MSQVIQYEHHGTIVYVDEALKGKHREHCLCWRCKKFYPDDREKNCLRANLLFEYCRMLDMVTPVYECTAFA